MKVPSPSRVADGATASATASALVKRGSAISCTDSEDVSDVSSDVSSRLSPLTPSPDFDQTIFLSQGGVIPGGVIPGGVGHGGKGSGAMKDADDGRKGFITGTNLPKTNISFSFTNLNWVF